MSYALGDVRAGLRLKTSDVEKQAVASGQSQILYAHIIYIYIYMGKAGKPGVVISVAIQLDAGKISWEPLCRDDVV